jgi:hypothetical protein
VIDPEFKFLSFTCPKILAFPNLLCIILFMILYPAVNTVKFMLLIELYSAPISPKSETVSHADLQSK